MEVYKPSQKNTRCGISYSISIAIATYSQTSLSQGVMKCDLMLMLGRQMAIFFLLGCRSVNRNERDVWSLNAPWMTFFLCARSVISGTEVESLTSPNGGFNSWQAMIWCNNLISRHQVYICKLIAKESMPVTAVRIWNVHNEELVYCCGEDLKCASRGNETVYLVCCLDASEIISSSSLFLTMLARILTSWFYQTSCQLSAVFQNKWATATIIKRDRHYRVQQVMHYIKSGL